MTSRSLVPPHRRVLVALPLVALCSLVLALAPPAPAQEAPHAKRLSTVTPQPTRVTAPAPPRDPHPRRWAVLIGINTFGPGVGSLHWAVGDARRLQRVILMNPASGYTRDRVFLLTSDQDTPVTKTAILDALREVAGKARPRDALMVFISTHGVEIDGVPHLLTQETPRDLSRGLLSLREFLEAMSDVPAREQALIVDACHSGLSNWLPEEATGWGTNATRILKKKVLNRAVISSSRADELSYELPHLRSGLLSFFLARALTDRSYDLDFDGVLSAEEAWRSIVRGAGESGLQQTPWLNLSSGHLITLISFDEISTTLNLDKRVGSLRYAYHADPAPDSPGVRVLLQLMAEDLGCDHARIRIQAVFPHHAPMLWTPEIDCSLTMQTIRLIMPESPTRLVIDDHLLHATRNESIARIHVTARR